MAIGVTCAEKFGEDRTCSSEDMIADRQTDRQTDTLITMLRSPIGGGVTTIAILSSLPTTIYCDWSCPSVRSFPFHILNQLTFDFDFYPRDAMLARALAIRPCVCLSVCHKSVFHRNGWMNRAGFSH